MHNAYFISIPASNHPSSVLHHRSSAFAKASADEVGHLFYTNRLKSVSFLLISVKLIWYFTMFSMSNS
jgi:hypothetical protein